MIEINFVLEDYSQDDEVIMVKGDVVPPRDSLLRVRGKDYLILGVYWTIDYADGTLQDRRLRATVNCKALDGETA